MNLFSILAKGGIIVWLIGLLSVIGLAVVIERYLVLRRARRDVEAFMSKVRALVDQGNAKEALALATMTEGPIASIVKAGLEHLGKRREEIKTYVEEQARLEIYRLEKNLNLLATVAAISPLLGFLGTVTGMIRAFMAVQALGGSVDASVLAGGIWEALVTTAVGLTVGIPAYFFYNYFVGKVQEIVFFMEKSALEILDLAEKQGGP